MRGTDTEAAAATGAGIAASRLPSHPGKKSMTAEEHRIILEKRGSIFHGALRVVRRPKEAAAPAKSVRQSLVALQSVAAAQASHTRTPRAARPEATHHPSPLTLHPHPRASSINRGPTHALHSPV